MIKDLSFKLRGTVGKESVVPLHSVEDFLETLFCFSNGRALSMPVLNFPLTILRLTGAPRC